MNVFQPFPYYLSYYPTQPSTQENIHSYHSTSELYPTKEKEKEHQSPDAAASHTQTQPNQTPTHSPNPSEKTATPTPNTNNNPNYPVKLEQFPPDLLNSFCFPQMSMQNQLISMLQPDLLIYEYQSPQLQNIKDIQQKISYNSQLLTVIQQDLDRFQQKNQIPQQKLNGYYSLFFQKKGNAFSEKFSKPRPMSYKQNQSILLKKEAQNQKNSSSKFHNMTKLLMYTFLQMFQPENLESLGLPEFVQHHLKKLAKNIKLSGKKPKGPHNVIKTDCFNHAHYNALFLILTPENVKELSKHEREVEVHFTCYGIDLAEKPEVDQAKLRYVNIIKRFTYLVVKNSIGELENDSNNNTRTEYLQRAMVGINKLNQGNMIQRF